MCPWLVLPSGVCCHLTEATVFQEMQSRGRECARKREARRQGVLPEGACAIHRKTVCLLEWLCRLSLCWRVKLCSGKLLGGGKTRKPSSWGPSPCLFPSDPSSSHLTSLTHWSPIPTVSFLASSNQHCCAAFNLV